MTARRISPETLRSFMTAALNKIGVPEEDGLVVADNLLAAELQGITSHGLGRFPVYYRRVRSGLVNPKPSIKVKRSFPAVVMVDGDNGLGAVVAMRALEEGMAAADQYGVGAVGVNRSNHFGIAGYFCQQAANKGYITMVLTNGPPALPPWGGKEPYFGTNPIAFGLPRRHKPHIIVDMATAIAARGKIIEAAREGRPIPPGWALDRDGNPTTDAKAALDGVIMPIAGPKGYALSLAIEHLAGVLTVAGFGRQVAWQYSDSTEEANVGHLLLVLRPDAFGSLEVYFERTEQFCREIKAIAVAPGYGDIKLPGEREWERQQALLNGGIEISGALLAELAGIAAEHSLSLTPLPTDNTKI
ncbi:Ldh family oxidoreductase [Sporolituus thermophilus]|uniref:Malate/lactate/ureidoglycolate dehydrogenase, LDH2 family n=1 Tax=Sporolituus thermophilus DSM 23256 TaxID=1123285 RepID=A0A1G7JV09_9FIRM|nr:Ldh family oxidoreductase [Sporolituus thermophilus]SDF28790.1 Malate/lactate/ureidoglycolate dehydrogenase, LDH2 family [Sporolituus thermophilus DSM 23256]